MQLFKTDKGNTESSIFEAMDSILTLDHHVDRLDFVKKNLLKIFLTCMNFRKIF